MGFTLESLAAQTCDEFWSSKFVHRDTTLIQLVSMTNMAPYLECPVERHSDLNSSELATVLSVSTTTSTSHTLRQYILPPASATATLKRHCLGRPLNSKKQPRVVADLQMDSMPMQLELGLGDLRVVN
jgi:hypothetical protein